MNGLVTAGFVVLGGPLGRGEEVLLVIESSNAETVRARLDEDPWSAAGLLEVTRVEPWTILLDGWSPTGAGPSAGE